MDRREVYTKLFLTAAGMEVDAESIKKYKTHWWWNNRNKSQGGLRLTDFAMRFIEEHADIKKYKVDFPKEFSVTAQVLIWLDQYIDSPFYIDKKSITVLTEKAAFELYLFSGDVHKLGHNKALAKRFSQESL